MKNTMVFFWLLTATCTLEIACTQSDTSADKKFYADQYNLDFAYALGNPAQKFFMGFELEEISGMAYHSPGVLACVQDEEGKLYIYDLGAKKVSERLKFANSGDYEGVEIVKDQVYVLRSDGKLYQFPMVDNDDLSSNKIKTPLSSSNDVEGLGYDHTANQLLFACKGKGEIGEGKVKGRAIYGYDLDAGELSKRPLFTIQKKRIEKFLKKRDRKHKDLTFQPSAIALHPIENRYYILASDGKALAIINREFEIEEYINLKAKHFRQPEGLCFAPNGDMYIASEGRGGDGYILEFKFQKY